MKSFDILYSVLRYIPSAIRMESIIVGLAIHIPSIQYSHFYSIKNTRRVASFDDEYDKDFFHMVMDGLSYDLDYSGEEQSKYLLNDKKERFTDIQYEDFLDNRISYLANEFQFSPIESLQTSDDKVKKDLQDLQRMYLYYDRPKSKRITKTEVRNLLSKQLNSYNLAHITKSPKIYDDFGGNNLYDFQINNSILIKAISFDYKRINQLSTELKNIIYDLKQLNTENISKIILTRNDNLESLPKKQKLAFNNFEIKIKNIEAVKKLKIDLIPLSELEATLNKSRS